MGYPTIFIRCSGCTRECDYCDSKFHKEGEEFSVETIIQLIKDEKIKRVCHTGGEPCLQLDEIIEVIKGTPGIEHHIETNGDILDRNLNWFDYVCFSPKDVRTAKRIIRFLKMFVKKYDIKIVTDLEKVGVELIPYATILMPLSTFSKAKDKKIQQKVWNYCVENNVRYSPRLQVELFGKKRGV